LSKKKKNKQQEWEGEELHTPEEPEEHTISEPQEEEFNPEKHGIEGLDELAMRLQVPPTSDPEKGIVLFSQSGRVYSWIDLMSAHLAWSSQAVIHVNNMLEKVRSELKDELDKRAGQPTQTHNTNRNS